MCLNMKIDQLDFLLFWLVLVEHSSMFRQARFRSRLLGTIKDDVELEGSVWLSHRHGKIVTIPSISIQYVIENVCLKRGEYHLQFSFYTRENELIPSNNGFAPNLLHHSKYVAKLLKLTEKDGKFYMYIPVSISCKRENQEKNIEKHGKTGVIGEKHGKTWGNKANIGKTGEYIET